MKKLLVTVKPFQGTIPFRILQRGRCNQVNHLIPTRVLVKGGEITCKILK